jgi:hypothetical protein
LVGNLATEVIVGYLKSKGQSLNLNEDELHQALLQAASVFEASH